jgi:hypothetical protein
LVADDDADGAYTYGAEVAGIHTLVYRVNTNVESVLQVNVSAQSLVDRLEVNLSKTTLDQLATTEVSIRAFDAFDNEIAVPPSIKVDASGRATVTMISSEVWTITTLDDGVQTISVNVGSVRVDSEITVTGTTAGFFEAGGTLYYVGAGLLGLVAIVLLVLLVMFMRSGNEGWDDDDYDDDDDDDSPAPGPTGRAPGPSGPAPGQAVQHRVQAAQRRVQAVQHRVQVVQPQVRLNLKSKRKKKRPLRMMTVIALMKMVLNGGKMRKEPGGSAFLAKKNGKNGPNN